MSITRERRGGRTRFDVRWREEGRQRSRTFDLRRDAEEFEAQVRRRLQLGAHAPAEPSRETLAEWLRRWWDREAPGWAASTRMHRGYIIDKWVVPFVGGVRLRDLGPSRVRDWRTEVRERGCSANQSNQAQRVLSSALGAAVRDGLLPANPCAGVRKLPVTVSRPRALTPLELELIRAEMPTARDAVMVSLLAYAGLRPEELLALQWRDAQGGLLVVDQAWTHGELKSTKTGRRRTVEIVAPLAEDLEALRPRRPDPEALVAPSETGGYLNLNNWRNRVWNPACQRAGVTAAPYDCRHSYCSLLINEGRSPVLVAAAMGHVSGEMVWRRYAHLYDLARLAPATPMVAAIEAARAELRAKGVRWMCDRPALRVLAGSGLGA